MNTKPMLWAGLGLTVGIILGGAISTLSRPWKNTDHELERLELMTRLKDSTQKVTDAKGREDALTERVWNLTNDVKRANAETKAARDLMQVERENQIKTLTELKALIVRMK